MAFYWKLPPPSLTLNDDSGYPDCDSTSPSHFWKLPLPSLSPDCNDGVSTTASKPFSPSFWKLPLPALEDELQDVHLASTEVGSSLERPMKREEAPAPSEVDPRCSNTAECETKEAEQEAPPKKEKKNRSLHAEMTEMLNNYVSERAAFENNIRELAEMQQRLQKLTVQAAAGGFDQHGKGSAAVASTDDTGTVLPDEPSSAVTIGALVLPDEVVGRVQRCLDVASLGRSTGSCRAWASLASSEERWSKLCIADWGIRHGGERQDYKNRLEQWHLLWSTMEGVKNSPVCGTFGSTSRKRLFSSLAILADLGTVLSTARYPSKIHALMKANSGGKTLLALLDDESPYLLCLGVRCLADYAANAEERPMLRAEVVSRGPLLRSLLEGEDADVVEAAARMMLNLHGGPDGAPGTPILPSRRGPWEFLEEEARAVGGLPALQEFGDIMAEPWSGAWSGEMRYARGGERHSSLRLVLGPKGDPNVEQAMAVFRQIQLDEDGGRAENSSSSTRTEGRAEYWHYFGFLAESDFESVAESVQYVDAMVEQRKRTPSSPSKMIPRATQTLVGAGWDEQNGFFTLEAALPQPPALMSKPPPSPASGPSTPASPYSAGKNAVPLKMLLKYENRGSTYELTGFLAEGSPGVEAEAGTNVGHVVARRALYGV